MDNSFEKVYENQVLNQWINCFQRSPNQRNSPHESDAEIIQIDGCRRLLAISTDTINEEIQLGLYQDPYTIGWMIVMVNFSDLAAVGAIPTGFLLSVSWLEKSDKEFKKSVAKGMNAACHEIGTFLIGGDTNESSALSLTGVALGTVDKEFVLSRIGMKTGDYIYMSAPCGAGNLLAAAKFITRDNSIESEIKYRPKARILEGQILSEFASACMDTSDGLFSTIDQLMRLNNTGIRIESEWSQMVVPEGSQFKGFPQSALLAGYHGEYELVFSIPEINQQKFLTKLSTLNWQPVYIGRATKNMEIMHQNESINTLFFRNLLIETGNNVEQYIKILIDACIKL